MCGPSACVPMHPGCTWSPEHKAECLSRRELAERLILQSSADWDGAVRELRRYEENHGKPQADKLRAEIKRQKNLAIGD